MTILRLSAFCVILSLTIVKYASGKDYELTIVVLPPELNKYFIINGKTVSTPASFKPQEWILPNNSRVPLGFDDGNMKVMADGWQLYIHRLADAHMGTYQLALRDPKTGATQMEKRTLMLQTNWERYRINVIVGCVAAVACLGILLVICLVYHNRWRSTDEQRQHDKHYEDKPGVDRSSFSHDNPTFTNEL